MGSEPDCVVSEAMVALMLPPASCAGGRYLCAAGRASDGRISLAAMSVNALTTAVAALNLNANLRPLSADS